MQFDRGTPHGHNRDLHFITCETRQFRLSLISSTVLPHSLFMSPVYHPHFQTQTRSYKNLDKSRKLAAKTSNYDSAATRARVTTLFQERFGAPPRDWQLDVTEAILLGLDSVVIAGTGAGKTMPFMMPLLLDESKKSIIISPLKVLQDDQVCRKSPLFLVSWPSH